MTDSNEPNPPETTIEAVETATPETAPVVDPGEVDLKANINELLSKARKDEKDKMYGKVDKLTEEKKAADERVKTLEEQVATLIKADPDKETDVKPNSESLSAEAIQEMLAEQLNKMETDVFKPAMDKLSAENALLKEENNQSKLTDLKNTLINNNKDSIIEELIQGTTSEELEASLVTAKQAFAKYNKLVTDKVTTAISENGMPPTPALNGDQPSSQAAGTMSLTEFAKNRTALLAEAAQKMTAQFNQ